jgi:arginyl-tRNA synthetase
VHSDGALCAFPPGFTGREGRPLPLIIRKSDGGYNYSTTDLATIRYRVDELHADRAIYVVGSDQALHFQMVFAVAREAGWIPPGPVRARPDRPGLRPDGNRLRTRSGDSVSSATCCRRRWTAPAASWTSSRRRPGSSRELDAIAEAVGIGAVKYADLSTARESAYVFDWDRMISFRGNTGPYLQYATARIRSIFRRAGGDADPLLRGSRVAVTAASERALALRLLGFGAVVTAVARPPSRTGCARTCSTWPACSPRSTRSARC